MHAHTAAVAGRKNDDVRGRTSPLAAQAPRTTKQDPHKHELYIAESYSYWLNSLTLTHRGLFSVGPMFTPMSNHRPIISPVFISLLASQA